MGFGLSVRPAKCAEALSVPGNRGPNEGPNEGRPNRTWGPTQVARRGPPNCGSATRTWFAHIFPHQNAHRGTRKAHTWRGTGSGGIDAAVTNDEGLEIRFCKEYRSLPTCVHSPNMCSFSQHVFFHMSSFCSCNVPPPSHDPQPDTRSRSAPASPRITRLTLILLPMLIATNSTNHTSNLRVTVYFFAHSGSVAFGF